MRLTVTILAFALCLANPGFAQNVPAGDDVWNTSGGGATYATIDTPQWVELCGESAPSQTINMTGKNIPGYGTGDTVITRLAAADFSQGSTVTVPIRLKKIGFISQGTTPCSPNLIRMRENGTQNDTQMTITREDSLGGTFSAVVDVTAVYEVVDSAGNVAPGTGSVPVNAEMREVGGPAPWSYRPPSGSLNPNAPWHPGVSKTTLQPVQIRRSCLDIILNEHAYVPAKTCKVIVGPADPVPHDDEPVPTDTEPWNPDQPHEPTQTLEGARGNAIAVPVENCSVSRTLVENL